MVGDNQDKGPAAVSDKTTIWLDIMIAARISVHKSRHDFDILYTRMLHDLAKTVALLKNSRITSIMVNMTTFGLIMAYFYIILTVFHFVFYS